MKKVVGVAAVCIASLMLAPSALADSEMKKSAYRGKWFRPGLADCREAIMQRESNFSYSAKSGISTASGAYQFLDSQWRGSLVHILRPEIKKDFPNRLATLESLVDKPINRWARFYQDMSFYTVVVKNDGLKHWSPIPSACR